MTVLDVAFYVTAALYIAFLIGGAVVRRYRVRLYACALVAAMSTFSVSLLDGDLISAGLWLFIIAICLATTVFTVRSSHG